MRKIEQQMIKAIYNRKSWQSGNTMVRPIDAINSVVCLHMNNIADVNVLTRVVTVHVDMLRRYPTNTTKSRLRALGADVATRKGVTYLNNVAI